MWATDLRIVPVLAVLATAVACASGNYSTPTDSASAAPVGHTYLSTDVHGPRIPGDGPLRLTFTEGRLSATAGCNTLMGSADLSGHTLRTGPLASTRMACVGDRAGADEWATALLQASPTWSLDGTTLTLKTTDRTVRLQESQPAG
ncbi:META domain-containing protein [Nocardia veterana]|uniref:META domain-containing protein n=1 Tax=Nocardia veterana TaxID=132249 RepID=A0A7X6LVH0_9NOCA|nr:META domain-containing protein [Nocardia veterana]NKY85344.1 META domain-containing protein [Nocardia veterana]